MKNIISIRGAREHNLKNVDLDIPKNQLNVITGVSGSGKSSLAFDTIYAEGQRRYVESLSAYARQFLGIMDKPDVDTIDGLSPAISIDQKTTSHNPRSTVGTITEIYDYMRLLFARVGHPHCPNDGSEIMKMSVDEISVKVIEKMQSQIAGDKIKPHVFGILSPVVRQKKGEFKELFDNLRSKGYAQVTIDGKQFSLNDEINLIKTNKHTISLVIDEISVSFANFRDELFMANLRSRLANDIEQASSLSDGLINLRHESVEHLYSEKFSCPVCGLSLPELEPRMFSFNSPLGACEACKGLGTIFKIDAET
ncbi:excinuclease ABC subunit UvrA, partial [Candidatus Microgenomates bacterium]|nr:excinuclease ABC subunit UvrA [Candidatus Microgenomates bacterium]